MNRVELLTAEETSAVSPTLQERLPTIERQFGAVPNSLRLMARRPKLIEGILALSDAVWSSDGTVPPEIKQLVSNIASKTAGSRYCQAHTIHGLSEADVDQVRLADLWAYGKSSLYTPAEKAAMDFASAAASVPNGVTDELMARMKAHWDDDQIVEIMGVVALFGFLNRWNDSLATPLEAGPAESANDVLGRHGWEIGKHRPLSEE